MGDRIIVTDADQPKPPPEVVVVAPQEKPKPDKVVTEKTTTVKVKEEE
jgi:hypothetical protein